MMPVWFGAMNMPMPTEFKKMSAANTEYEKFDRQHAEQDEGECDEHEASGGKGTSPVAVGQHAAEWRRRQGSPTVNGIM